MNRKHVIAFVCGMLSDFWLSGCSYTVNHGMPYLMFFFNATFPVINWIGLMQVVDCHDSKERIKLAVLTGIGYGIGSTFFYLITPHL